METLETRSINTLNLLMMFLKIIRGTLTKRSCLGGFALML